MTYNNTSNQLVVIDMHKFFVLGLLIGISLNGLSQGSRFQFEPFIGAQHIHHHECNLPDPKEHQGFTMSTGFRLIFDISERVGILTGYTLHSIAGDNLKFPQSRKLKLDLKFKFGHFEWFERLTFTGECGVEYSFTESRFQLPLFLGTQFKINDHLDWNIRFRPPSIRFLTDKYGSFGFVEFTGEMGISYRLVNHPKPKFEDKNGNPFILQ